MKKRTNSVISSMYHPIGNSRFKTAACMFGGGVVLLCLGVGLIVTTSLPASRPVNSHVDQTSVLISGPTCLGLGIAVAAFAAADMFRYRRARNTVESELNRVIGGMSAKPGVLPPEQAPPPKISIVINRSLWPS